MKSRRTTVAVVCRRSGETDSGLRGSRANISAAPARAARARTADTSQRGRRRADMARLGLSDGPAAQLVGDNQATHQVAAPVAAGFQTRPLLRHHDRLDG